MKRKLLFVIESLGIGGAEKSLITLLNLIDYDSYEVDLQLFSYGGPFTAFLPSGVNLLPPIDFLSYLGTSLVQQLKFPARFLSRCKFSMQIRRGTLSHPDIARICWETMGKYYESNSKEYDVAIAYAQGVPTFYVFDKIKAKKKLAWVNAICLFEGETKRFNEHYYSCFDAIVPVSSFAKDALVKMYPDFEERMHIMPDLIDESIINRMAAIEPEKAILHDKPVVMTVGRLDNGHKGYDLAIEAADLLRNQGLDFRWYVVGDGPFRVGLEQFIRDHSLDDCFILLGPSSNPYAYMKECDVYVQPSRHEGFGLTIAEAKVLNKPIVCTNFNGSDVHIKNGENGLKVAIDAKSIAKGVEKLLLNVSLRSSIIINLSDEKKGNVEELVHFYELID